MTIARPTRREVLLGGAALLSGTHALAAPVPARKLRIVVVGAGMAGMAAADALLARGHEVTVLEATLRPGGRVRTLREPFSDGLFAEAGAGRIPTTHGLTRQYVRRLGLTLRPYRPKGAEVSRFGEKRFVVRPGEKLLLSRTQLPFSEAEKSLDVDGLARRYIERYTKEIGAIPPEAWPLAAPASLIDRSVEQVLRDDGASEAAIGLLCFGFNGDSAADFLRDAWSHEAPALDHVVGGNDRLPTAFAATMRDHIRYGTPVVRIRQTVDAVEVVADGLRAGQTYPADRVIVTAPAPALRAVEFVPALSVRKAEAIAHQGYGAVTRVYLQFRRRYWEQAGLSGFANLDVPMEVWNATFDQPGRRGILLGYMFEALARKVAAMGPDERIRFFLEQAEQLFPGAKDELEGGASFSWHEQPFQQGAFFNADPAETLRNIPVFAAAEGRIHFAGEHTSAWPGWIQGALHSGLRAAREVLAAG
jgi:monoamine oxidase